MRTKIFKYVLMLLIFMVFVISWYAMNKYKEIRFKDNIQNRIESAEKEMSMGEQKKVFFENKFKADLCIVCRPYADKELIGRVAGFKIDKSTAKKIDKICNWGEENWALVLIKNKVIVFYCYLTGVLEVKNPESDDILIKQIQSDKFSFSLLKIRDDSSGLRGLQLLEIE